MRRRFTNASDAQSANQSGNRPDLFKSISKNSLRAVSGAVAKW